MKQLLISILIAMLCSFLFLAVGGIAQEDMPTPQTPSATIGLGARMQGSVPLALGELRLGNIGIGAEVGLASGTAGIGGLASASVSILIAGASGRLLFPFEGLPIAPYMGASVMLLRSTATVSILDESATSTASTVGLGAFGGAELALGGIPISLFADIRFLSFRDLALTVDGESIALPINISGLSFSVGGRLDFRF